MGVPCYEANDVFAVVRIFIDCDGTVHFCGRVEEAGECCGGYFGWDCAFVEGVVLGPEVFPGGFVGFFDCTDC